MAAIIAIAIVVVLIVGARAGTGSSRAESESNAPVCPLCRNYLPCNCSHDEDTSHGHHHRHGQWSRDSVDQTSQNDWCPDHAHQHRDSE